MKILAISHPCVTDVNQQFYAELESIGHDVNIVVPKNFVTQYSQLPVQVVRWHRFSGDIVQLPVGFRKHIQFHYYKESLARVIRRYRPDVLYVEEEPYSVTATQAFLASDGMTLRRIVYSAQNILKTYPAPFRWMERYVLTRADGAAVTSDGVSTVLGSKGFRGEHIPFPLGVDTEQFRQSREDRDRIRARLGFNDSNFVVGYVGRFVMEKGIEVLLRMVPSMHVEGIKMVCVGNGPMSSVLEQRRNIYRGTLTIATGVAHRDIHRWMNAFDCLIIPSLTTRKWKEQFGRVILEAMACQTPVLGSDSGEIPNLIHKTGGGWVFPEGDNEKAMSVLRMIRANQSLGVATGRVGSEAVLQRYSKKSIAATFSDYLTHLYRHSKDTDLILKQ